MTAPLRLGTRASALALAQSGHVADALRRLGVAVEVVPLSTPGDGESAPLAGRAHEGIFVSSVRDALIDGAIDLAVHSYKDVPTDPADGLVVAAVPEREDPRDTVVSRAPGLAALPAGAIVGTCSVRRAAWVHRVRPDLQVAPIRGNIDQRVALVRDGRYDATLLAAAGLNRLGCGAPAVEVIALTDLVPAPAQGALALECRAVDTATRMALHALDHHGTHAAATAERALLAAIDPSDGTAVGAVALLRGRVLHLLADLCEPDGSGRVVVRTRAFVGAGPVALGQARALGLRTAGLLDGHRAAGAVAS